MDKSVLLTIVVPVYNCQRFIGATVESIIRTTKDFPVEVIFQNANSNDGTSEVIDEYVKKYKNLVHYNERDKGQSDAINRGAAKARGVWVTWLCADDLYLVGFNSLLKTLSKTKFDVVFGDCVMLQNGTVNFAVGTEDFQKGKLAKKRQYIQQPGTCVRKTKWDQINGLDLSLNWTMDYDLFLRLEAAGANFSRIKTFVSVARIWEEAKTSSGSFKRLMEHFKVIFRFQRRHLSSLSLASYSAYFIEYLIKKMEEKGISVRPLHRVFWKITKPAEKDQIEKRFNDQRAEIEKNIKELER